MKILYVTNMYPSKERIHDGIFIKEQVDYYTRKYKVDFEIFIIKGQQSKLNYLKSIFLINWINARKKIDLIHIHFGISGIFLLFNPFIRTPSVVTLHGSDLQSYKRKDGIKQIITKLVARKVKRVIVQNDNMLYLLKKEKNKVVKIPCGIDSSKFNLDRNNDDDVFLIGFPSNKERLVKNYSLFKRIIDQLVAEGFNVKSFEFVNLTRKQVAVALSRLDCLLMTSLSEGSPQMIKEALAGNVPVISTDVGDVKILLKGVKNCFVVDSYDVEPFVQRIKRLMKLKPCDRKTDGSRRLRELALDQDVATNKIHKLYTEVLKDIIK